jgi:hypothetical protein
MYVVILVTVCVYMYVFVYWTVIILFVALDQLCSAFVLTLNECMYSIARIFSGIFE